VNLRRLAPIDRCVPTDLRIAMQGYLEVPVPILCFTMSSSSTAVFSAYPYRLCIFGDDSTIVAVWLGEGTLPLGVFRWSRWLWPFYRLAFGYKAGNGHTIRKIRASHALFDPSVFKDLGNNTRARRQCRRLYPIAGLKLL
jgi:hypothetical protein